MKTHILGMAKSSLSLEGAKSSKLELDFFKLAFAVAALRENNEEAFGYLLVVSEVAKKRAEYWVNKYKTGDRVKVLIAVPSSEQLIDLTAEKSKNANGIYNGETSFSVAKLGMEFGEAALRKQIEALYPHIAIRDKSEYPQSINWDYYGIVDIQNKVGFSAP
ncbi:MAG TPA: hypothetical protein VGB77_05920 [Abditibacteriaceae bacterium]|jgi:hypothetical protein